MTKPPRVLWSKAAFEVAGDRLAAFHEEVAREIGASVEEGLDEWMPHAVARDEPGWCLLHDAEEDAAWVVRVRLSTCRALVPLPEDHPDPDRRGMVREAEDTPDNECFAPA